MVTGVLLLVPELISSLVLSFHRKACSVANGRLPQILLLETSGKRFLSQRLQCWTALVLLDDLGERYWLQRSHLPNSEVLLLSGADRKDVFNWSFDDVKLEESFKLSPKTDETSFREEMTIFMKASKVGLKKEAAVLRLTSLRSRLWDRSSHASVLLNSWFKSPGRER